jgi:hypothetical protein
LNGIFLFGKHANLTNIGEWFEILKGRKRVSWPPYTMSQISGGEKEDALPKNQRTWMDTFSANTPT